MLYEKYQLATNLGLVLLVLYDKKTTIGIRLPMRFQIDLKQGAWKEMGLRHTNNTLFSATMPGPNSTLWHT